MAPDHFTIAVNGREYAKPKQPVVVLSCTE